MNEEQALDRAAQELINEEPEQAVTEGPNQIIGYHFNGMSFFPGKAGVTSVALGDPPIPTMVMVKVKFRTQKPRLFMVPMSALIIEYNESPLVLPSSQLVTP